MRFFRRLASVSADAWLNGWRGRQAKRAPQIERLVSERSKAQWPRRKRLPRRRPRKKLARRSRPARDFAQKTGGRFAACFLFYTDFTYENQALGAPAKYSPA